MTSTCAIKASDFNKNTADSTRHEWNAGTMRHVVAALDGAPVAIVLDGSTGHTALGVRLVRVISSGTSGGTFPRVTVEYDLDDGKTQRTNHLIFELGETIVPMGNSRAKWDALDSVRKESGAAIARAKAEHGETAGRTWGSWNTRPTLDGVVVTYAPHGNPPAGESSGERGYWHYRPADLAVTA